ncbi:MAG: cytochrome c biogenesis CcdA family protein [Bacillota bacterium]
MIIDVNVSLWVAFTAGVLSFFSPCVIPLLPVYISQLAAGLSKPEQTGKLSMSVFIRLLIFVAGFTVVFVILGGAAGAAGRFLTRNMDVLLKVGGLFVIFMGLSMAGILRVSALARHWVPLKATSQRNWPGAFFLGAVFALGWTPCVGPVLASILTLAAVSSSSVQGALLLSVYSLGMAVPFLAVSLVLDRIPRLQYTLSKYSGASLKMSGYLLILLGILMFFNKLGLFSAYLYF